MERRTFVTAFSAAFALPIGGCSASREPDVERVQRLGGAPPLSLSESVQLDYDDGTERSFPEQATNLAAESAAARVAEILERESLTGQGVSVGHGVVELADIDVTATEQPTESAFNRATNRSPIVSHLHHYSRDGDLVSEPSVPFEAVVDETPRSVTVPVTDTTREYVAILPVMCDRNWIQNA